MERPKREGYKSGNGFLHAAYEIDLELYADFLESAKQQDNWIGVIDDIREENPYKLVGRPETYSEYNQGWEDACDRIESKLSALPSHPKQKRKNDE